MILFSRSPCPYGRERPHRDVLGGIAEVPAHVDAGHDAGEGGEEDSEHAEPVVPLGVVGAEVGAPRGGVPAQEAIL